MPTVEQAEIKKIKQRAILLGMRVLSEVEKDDLTDGGNTSLHGHTGGGAAWGGISGTLSNQSDLNSALGGKADAAHTHSYEPANANIQSHVTAAHAPSDAQKNSDITKAEIETKLTGAISSHSHAGGGGMNLLKKTADQTINAGIATFVDIADLTFPVVSGVDYAFHFYITFQSAATTTGWKAGVNCPTGTLDFWAQSDVIANGAAGVATHTERHNTVRDDMTLLTATVTQAVDLAVRIEGRYKCTANGTFAARFANELANINLVVQKGSWGWYF